MSVKTREIINFLERMIPRSLSCDWDNDGAMVFSDEETSKGRILLTLDATLGALQYAKEQNCDLVISHHPLIFKPLKALTGDTVSGRAAIYAIKHGITVLSYHTRLDARETFGVNDTLAEILGIEKCEKFGPEGEEIGRIGVLPTEVPFDSFCSTVKSALAVDTLITVRANESVRKVALLGGDGKDYLIPALKAGADTFLTGRCGYNLDIDAAQYGINVIEAGHYNTEAPVLRSLEKLLADNFAELEFLYYKSDLTKSI